MAAYLIRRTRQATPFLLMLSIMLFRVARIAPESPLAQAERNPTISREQPRQLRIRWELAQPRYIQFVQWIRKIERVHFAVGVTEGFLSSAKFAPTQKHTQVERVRTTFSGARWPTNLRCSTKPPKMGRTQVEKPGLHPRAFLLYLIYSTSTGASQIRGDKRGE